jgi:hypothetical protein
MTCTIRVSKDSKSTDEVFFVCECDDGRQIIVEGLYFERFVLADILYQTGMQLANSTMKLGCSSSGS